MSTPNRSPGDPVRGIGRLAGRGAIVTGGGNGIGRAVVERYLEEGAKVAVLERSEESARELTREFGSDIVVSVGDVRDYASHLEILDRAKQSFGQVDIYVGNAGIYDFGRSLEEIPEAEMTRVFREVFEVNVLGYLLGLKATLPELRENSGCVVLTASSSSYYAGRGGPLYVGSKHAVAGLVKKLAREYAPAVRVNAVAPGATRTSLGGVENLDESKRLDQHPGILDDAARSVPLKFVSEPEDHAGLYVTLADPRDSRYVTGLVVGSDGGIALGSDNGTVSK